MARNLFTTSTELLLLIANHSGGIYAKESDILPKAYRTAHEAIAGDDDFVRAIRFDLVGLKGEDVTEECAAAWLSDFSGDPDFAVPTFVDRSEAWAHWCVAYDEQNPRWRGRDPDQAHQERLDRQLEDA